jgi:Na+/H+ antiporter NhaC
MTVSCVIALGPCRMASRELMDHIFRGMGGMIPVVSLLVLAFALGGVVRELGTGAYAAGLIGGAAGAKVAVAGLFFLASFMAFATGTSWGTFALMVPIAVPLATAQGGALPLYLAAVLGGGVFGDHCSPISDTTILSSMASGCDHIEHVRTQLPYAMSVGLVALFIGTLPTGYGLPWWVALPAGGAVLYALIRFLGRLPEEAAPSPRDTS